MEVRDRILPKFQLQMVRVRSLRSSYHDLIQHMQFKAVAILVMTLSRRALALAVTFEVRRYRKQLHFGC